MNSSIDYYNKNANGFHQRTINADMSSAYEKFLGLIPKQSKILDAGCGSGRDARYFKKNGYHVTAFDGSKEMVKLASSIVGQPIHQLNFYDMDFSQTFDGVWANASLLHIPYKDMRLIFNKLNASLKPNGILFASFKYGHQHMPADERDFYNMNEEIIFPYIQGLFEIIELWKMPDTRSMVAPSPDKAWLYILCRKQSF